METLMIEIRGQRVRVTQASHMRWWSFYQGGEYFEFRSDGASGWLLSQCAEWDCHDPSYVVGRGATLQAAAEDYSRSVTRRTGPRPGAPSATRRRDLAVASIDDLVSVLGAATRLGYDDGRAGTSARTGNAIAYALALATWTGLQQMQLRQAYMTGREHGVSERLRGNARSAPASARRPPAGTTDLDRTRRGVTHRAACPAVDAPQSAVTRSAHRAARSSQ